MTIIEIREMLGWCSLINLGLLMLFFVMWCFMRPAIYKIHSKFTPISEEHFNVVIYGTMAIWKTFVIAFIVIPWVVLCIMT